MQATHIDMRGNQYPFGELPEQTVHDKRTLIRKRMPFRNSREFRKMHEAVDVLKKVSHKNTINLRSAQENKEEGHIDLFYPYVHIPLEESFSYNPDQTVKQLHKQFIQLAIYLAKNYILTSFNPTRCGVLLREGRSVVKYYLPLNEIIITENISMLERSVQLFTLQSMHYLDTLAQQAHNTTLEVASSVNSSNHSQHQRNRLSHLEQRKIRKESQPVNHFNFLNRQSTSRRSSQIRKLSTLSKEMSEFSQMRSQRKKESTRYSPQSIPSIGSSMRIWEGSKSSSALTNLPQSPAKDLERRVEKLKERSKAALARFGEVKAIIRSYRSLSPLLGFISANH